MYNEREKVEDEKRYDMKKTDVSVEEVEED